MNRRTNGRWRVGLLGVLALAGFGLLFANATVLTAAVIPLTFVLYSILSSPPAKPTFECERLFRPSVPSPGEAVSVTLTIENTSDHTLPDFRIIDGVPDELAVIDGSPRICTPLAAGEAVTVEYTVIAKRGEYQFDDPLVRVTSLAGSEQLTGESAVSGESVLTCANAIRDLPIDSATLPRAGTLSTDSGGSGLEFYATRQYRSGDPMNRIDWRHYAKTNEFVSIEYREEQAARTIIVVDARPAGRVAPAAGYPTGTALCGYAGERLYDALDRTGVLMSVTAVGLESETPNGLVSDSGLAWVDPEMESESGVQISAIFRAIQEVADKNARPVSLQAPDMFDRMDYQSSVRARNSPYSDSLRTDGVGRTIRNTHSSNSRLGPDRLSDELIVDREETERYSNTIEHLIARLPPNAQVVLCTPLVDNWPVTLARALDDRGYPTLCISPNVFQHSATGQRIASVHRQLRIRTLQRLGEVVTWEPEQSIDYAISHSLPYVFTNQ